MTTPLTAQSVAELVDGDLRGSGTTALHRVAALDRAGPDALSFLSSPKYLAEFRASSAGAVLVAETLADEPEGPGTRIVVADPMAALLTVAAHFEDPTGPLEGVHPSAILGAGVDLGDGVAIGPYCVLGRGVRIGARSRLSVGVVVEDGVTIGEDTTLGVHVVCHRGTTIGNAVTIQAGSVIGGVGFGFHSDASGHHRIPHVGRCVIEDHVEIGSNVCIDRGSVDDTVIGAGTKIDNLVQIAHNVRIGRGCFIAGLAGTAGSVRLGDGVVMAGQAGISGHLSIGDGARLAAQSGVSSDVPAGADYGGSPARPHRETMRAQAASLRLGKIMKDLEALVEERKRRG